MKIRLLLAFVVMSSLGLAAGGYGNSSSPQKREVAANADQEPAKIPGIVIERKSGDGFLGLELVDYKYKLTFYGPDKKPQEADYPRALFRWSKINGSGEERYMLSRNGDGDALTSPRYVKPPHNFRLFIVLLDDDEDTESETYHIHFRP